MDPSGMGTPSQRVLICNRTLPARRDPSEIRYCLGLVGSTRAIGS